MTLSNVRVINGLSAIQDTTRMVICDLWGVMHDGVVAHPEAVDAINHARRAGIKTVFLSNAPRPRSHVRAMLTDMDIPETLTDHIVTSGGLARDAIRNRFKRKRLYHLGPDSDHNTIEGLPVEHTDTPDNADLILATGLDFNDVESHREFMAEACKRSVPFLCANPDRVVHVGERLFICAGAVADIYADMGGHVEWFGKPTAASLRACLKECNIPEKSIRGNNIIMVGDSLQTDVAGAHAAGFNSLFIAGGIHREEWPQVANKARNHVLSETDFQAIFGEHKPMPNFMSRTFRW
ncbi:TIGR01459 family HAD-type hydrolase [Kordiimonas aquimaris]|uniref:TIGR01459 family HAD-type hydrolase n=1 Tax=Kordiimonas aquimaris TaxID=707591 RepID=UPI0021D305FA|nr:TIGR01459 family HAD-type hydrolase [Kordiimonas aquimaris]